VKEVLTQVLVKYNDVQTNKEWIMDLKDQDPPTNLIAMLAVQKTYVKGGGKPADCTTASKGTKDHNKNWKYAAPKTGKSETKWVKKTNGTKEKHLWCSHEQCKRWTLSHGTEGHHGQKVQTATSRKPPKAEDMKLQSALNCIFHLALSVHHPKLFFTQHFEWCISFLV
jgi:hypothetical protein